MVRNRVVQIGGVLTAVALVAACGAEDSEEPQEQDSDVVESEQQTPDEEDSAETDAEEAEAAEPDAEQEDSAETGAEDTEAAEPEAAEETDESEADEQAADEDGWVEAESSSGEYVAEFPAEPQQQSQAVPDLDADQEVTLAEVGGAAFMLTEVPLGGVPFDLDGSVQGSIQGVLSNLEQQTGEQGEVIPLSEETGDFEGEETREAAVDVEVGDFAAHYRTLVFVREDTLVQVAYTGEQSENQDDVDRFFDSFELN